MGNQAKSLAMTLIAYLRHWLRLNFHGISITLLMASH